MLSFQHLILTTLLAYGLAYPTDFDIRRILDRLYSYPEAPEILTEDQNWPDHQVSFGQVGGVAVSPNDDVVVFHRGPRKWSWNTFNSDNTYAQKHLGPIKTDTIVHLDPKTGQKTHSHGANKFYMPHGLTVDTEGNHWLTDVALHQVFKFKPGSSTPDLELGTPFIPGNTSTTFCKPTDVAVASNGDFFVGDGYCNSRVIKFSKDGKFLAQFGREVDLAGRLSPDMFSIPHSLALVEDKDLLCVADREDSRVQCFNAGLKDSSKTGQFVKSLVKPGEIGRVYAIDYSPVQKFMYAVVKPDDNEIGARGFTINVDATDKRITDSWGEVGAFSHSQPHDVAVSRTGSDVYVGDVGDIPRPVTRFRQQQQVMVG